MTRSTNLQIRFEIANPGELPNPPNALPDGWPLLVHRTSAPGVLLRSLRERATAPLRLPELDRMLASCVPAVDPGDSGAAADGFEHVAESMAAIDSRPKRPWPDANGPWSARFGPFGFRIAARPGRRPCLTCRPRGRAARRARINVNVWTQSRKEAMRIVCGTDFTRSSIDAGLVAAAFARRSQGRVILAHALDSSRYKWPPRELLEYLRGSRRTKLALEANRLRLLDTEVDEAFLEGPPASRLIGEVTRTEASLVVVGAPSPAGPGGWLIGSVPERLAQDCPVPVLVVRDFQPLETWMLGERPLEVVVGYDFTAGADDALRWAASLRNFGRCRITVSHVIWPAEAAARLGLPQPANAYDCPPALQQRLEWELQEKCTEILGKESPGIAMTVALGRPDPHLIEVAGSRRADLLVVGTRRRRGLHRLGSVSRGVLRSAPHSVVCVPRAPVEGETLHSLRRVERVTVPLGAAAWANHALPTA